jgi:hypothetical protein
LLNKNRVWAAVSYWLFPGDQAGRGPSDVAAKRERERERDLEQKRFGLRVLLFVSKRCDGWGLP